MRFRLIDVAKEDFPVQRACKVLGVSQSGYFAWRDRPACRRQREDMVLLAHVRSAFALSLGTYGSPRMTCELQEGGLKVGRRRTARLMRENGLRARQNRRYKRTTDSQHGWPVAPNLIDQNFEAERPDEKWGRRHLLCLDSRGVAVSGRRHRPLRPPRRRLGWRPASSGF